MLVAPAYVSLYVCFAHVHGCSCHGSFGPQDVTLSLLRAIINNIGQLSFLNAKNCGIKRVVFTGNFLRNDPYIMATVNHALQFWSQGEMEVRHRSRSLW